VTRGAAAAVLALLRVDGDRQGRAHRLAQLAGDAALLAVGIAAQRMDAAEARRLRRLLHRVHQRVLGLEQVLEGQTHALQQLDEQQALEVRNDSVWRAVAHLSLIVPAGTRRSTPSTRRRRSRRSTAG